MLSGAIDDEGNDDHVRRQLGNLRCELGADFDKENFSFFQRSVVIRVQEEIEVKFKYYNLYNFDHPRRVLVVNRLKTNQTQEFVQRQTRRIPRFRSRSEVQAKKRDKRKKSF